MSQSGPPSNDFDNSGSIDRSNVNTGSTHINSPQTTNHISNTYHGGTIQLRCPQPPPAPPQFGGRHGELAQLKQRLKGKSRVAITSLNGQGGVGKTTLARQLAHDLYHEPIDQRVFRAVLWLELTPNPNGLALLREAATQASSNYALPEGKQWEELVGPVGRLLHDAIQQYCAECQPGRVLVVLDDVWQNGVDLAQTLMDKLCPPHSTVLVTTRDLNVAARLGVKLGQRQDLAYLSQEAGAELLAEYLDNLPRRDLESLSAALGGYTLALTLAAKRLLAEPNPACALPRHLEQYRQEIPAGSPFTDLELEQGQRKEDNLTRSLQYSYEALTDLEKACFRALGALVSDQPFNLELLTALWQVSAQETAKIHKRLWQLALLEEDTATQATYEGDWYRQHPVLFSYARTMLLNAGELNKRQRDFANYFVDRYRSHHPDHRWINPYFTALTTLLGRSAADPHLSLILLTDMADLLRVRGELNLLKTYLPIALKAAQTFKENTNKVRLLASLGKIEERLGELEKAQTLYEQALDLYKVEQDHLGQADMLSSLGDIRARLGNVNDARTFYDQAMYLFEKAEDWLGQANVLLDLGNLERQIGNIVEAHENYEKALPLYKIAQDQLGQANVLLGMGDAEGHLGNQENSRVFYNQALLFYKVVEDGLGQANVLRALGNLDLSLWNIEAAKLQFDKALMLYQTEQSRLGQAHVLLGLGDLERQLGNLESAQEKYEEALPLFLAEQDRLGQAHSLRRLGGLERQLGNLESVLEYYNKALSLYLEEESRLGQANVLLELGILRFEMGAEAEGLHNLEEAVRLHREVQNLKGAEIAEKRLAELRQQQVEQAEREKE